MRIGRVKSEGAGYYHCISRVVDRGMRLGPQEKEKFYEMMRKVESFSGAKILTYCIMSNHFHILVHVPEREEISDKELLRRLRLLYPKIVVKNIARVLEQAREEAGKSGNEQMVNRLREKYLRRMYDVSEFMKTLKQRFSVWYNKRNSRVGTLWEERFKSILVEGSENALITMAAYIDLNPVRAGIVRDPKDYRYGGYGEAVAGGNEARKGLGLVMLSLEQSLSVWGQINHKYRQMLYEMGERVVGANGQIQKRGFAREQVEKVIEEGGKLPLSDALRCRVRYFTDGVVLGGQEFVEKVFNQNRGSFGTKRKTGARSMRNSEWRGLCTMRDLRRDVITVGL
jgi:REP element-mobilizing transposase RayT